MSNIDSFKALKAIWIKAITDISPPLPYILVGTKADLFVESETEQITSQMVNSLMKKITAKYSIRCSSKIFSYTKGIREMLIKCLLLR